MLADSFKKLTKTKAKKVLDDVNPYIDGSRFEPEGSTVMAQDVTFYPEYSFLDLSDYNSHPPRKIFALYKAGSNDNDKHVQILNWTNVPIYEVNESAPIQLSESNILDYARFFFSYVRGRHGRFLLTETVEDIQWREDPPPAARKAVAKMIEPMKIIGQDEDGAFHLRCCLMFKDSLFSARVKITPTGEVDISEEELVLEDMPVFDDTLSQ